MTRQEELNEAWCKYRGKCSTEIIQALAFALKWADELAENKRRLKEWRSMFKRPFYLNTTEIYRR